MSTPNPAPGWYPAPHANNEQRYWDGTQWLDPQPAAPTVVLTDVAPAGAGLPASAAVPADPAVQSKPTPVLSIVALIAGIIAFFTGIVPIVGAIIGLGAIATGVSALVKRQRKGLAVAGIVLGTIAVITSVAVTAGISANLPAADKRPVAAVQQTSEPVDEEPPATITVPDVVGLPVSDAITTLEQIGLDAPPVTSFEDAAALVVSTSLAAGSETTEGAAITIVVAEKPKLTLGQQNAVAKAQDYLRLMGFSRTGLIDQLAFEGFSPEDSTFGADNAGADWNAECAEKAQDYLDLMAMSREGLIDQLAFEGFLSTEIDYALAVVGY